MKWSQSLTQWPVGEFLSPILAERNTEIMKLRLDVRLELPRGNNSFIPYVFFSRRSRRESPAIITTGVQLRFKPHVGSFLPSNLIIFSSCRFTFV